MPETPTDRVSELLRRIPATVGIAAIGVAASYFPVAVSNFRQCHDWTGQAAEQAVFMRGAPLLRVAHNCILLTTQNLVPPVFPMAKAWNDFYLRTVPPAWQTKVDASFEHGGAHVQLEEMQIEENAGLGFGVTGLLLLTFAATIFSKQGSPRNGSQKGISFNCP